MMKFVMIISVAAAIAGCTPSEQTVQLKKELAASKARVTDLERRVAKIEGDLYKVEVKSALKQNTAPKFVPAKDVERNVIDAKIEAFLKEYIGVAFDDSIERYPLPDPKRKDVWYREVDFVKKFRHFNKAGLHFIGGKLWRVDFFAEVERKYSSDSVEEQVRQGCADMAVTFDLASDAFEKEPHRGEDRSSYSLSREFWSSYAIDRAPQGYRRVGGSITNYALRRELEARQRAVGEKFPSAK